MDSFPFIGVDEVGRGSWAGPLLVVAARFVCCYPDGLRDSKLLTRKQRESLYEQMLHAFDFGEGWVRPLEIDKYGLAKSLKLGAARALRMIDAQHDEEIVVDGNVNYLPKKYVNSSSEVHGDDLIFTISAASVYAKVTRDEYMTKLAKKYPEYHFDWHVGYGTAIHLRAIKLYGPIKKIHRFSYSPVAKFAGVSG